MRRFAHITGWGKHLPSRVLTNQEISKALPTSDDWIVSRTGIRERRIAAGTDTPSSLGLLAAQKALSCAGLTPDDVDLIITATSSPDRLLPACSAWIQQGLGTRPVPAFDVNAACSGFLYGMHIADQFIQTGAYRNVLVVGTEVYSRMLNWEDRSTCVLFGDGAGAMVLQASNNPGGILSCVAGNDASGADLIRVPGVSASPDEYPNGERYLSMDGGPVFKIAVRAIADSTLKALGQAELRPDDVDLFIPHQANIRIIRSAAQATHIPEDRVFINVDRYGNTAAASIPIAVCEAVESGRLHDGDKLLLAGVGAGFSWASMVVQWGTG